MGDDSFYRALVFNFLSSLIIAVLVSYIFIAINLKGGVYLGILFGLYFLLVYALNNLVDARKIPNNYVRFIIAVVYIILFDVAYVFLIPLIFGPNAFPPTESLALNFGGVNYEILLSKEFYLVLFAALMLIFNFIIYRRTKRYWEE